MHKNSIIKIIFVLAFLFALTTNTKAETIDVFVNVIEEDEAISNKQNGNILGVETEEPTVECLEEEKRIISGNVFFDNDNSKNFTNPDEGLSQRRIDIIKLFVNNDVTYTVNSNRQGQWGISLCPGTYLIEVFTTSPDELEPVNTKSVEIILDTNADSTDVNIGFKPKNELNFILVFTIPGLIFILLMIVIVFLIKNQINQEVEINEITNEESVNKSIYYQNSKKNIVTEENFDSGPVLRPIR